MYFYLFSKQKIKSKEKIFMINRILMELYDEYEKKI